jgi:hypothetical protein
MHTQAPQIASRDPRHALRRAALIAGARLDYLVRTRADALSRRSMVGVALLAATVVALAHLRGAEVGAGLAGGQPGMLPLLLPNVTGDDGDDRPSGP